MYIGINGLDILLNEDKKFINWILASSINDNRSEISLSNGETFTINTSLENVYNIVNKSNNYALPPLSDIVYRFFAMNENNLLEITDDHITFNDNTKYENFFENSDILVETYELSINYHHHEI